MATRREVEEHLGVSWIDRQQNRGRDDDQYEYVSKDSSADKYFMLHEQITARWGLASNLSQPLLGPLANFHF